MAVAAAADADAEPSAKRAMPALRLSTALAESATLTAFLLEKAAWNAQTFEGPLPALVFQHQLYALVNDRTLVDREVFALVQAGALRRFPLDVGSADFLLAQREDYAAHVAKMMQATGDVPAAAAAAFLTVLHGTNHVSTTKEALAAAGLSELHINALVRCNAINVRDASSFFFGIPNIGFLVRDLRRGRDEVARLIRTAKFKELAEDALEKRRMKSSRLGARFHILDAVGRGAVRRVPVATGNILRLAPSTAGDH